MKYLTLILTIFFTISFYAQNQPARRAGYFNPAWSPDGKRIVFECDCNGKFAIYTINADGTGLKKLTDDNSDNGQARWSPDGKKIVFYSRRDGNQQIYLMDADGSNQRRLTKGQDFDSRPDFSSKGDLIVFQSRPPGNGKTNDIYTIRPDGNDRKRITDGKDNYVTPRWSPDNKKIVFTTISSFDKLFPNLTPEMIAKMPPDERFKAADKQRNSTEIFVMNEDGSNKVRLTNNEVRDDQVEWAKKSKTIFFLSVRDGKTNLFEMKADGTNIRKILGERPVNFLSVSNDGKFFVYERYVNEKSGLYIYNVKTKEEKLLIEG